MGVGQSIQQTGFANVRTAAKSDFRSLISGKFNRSRCALDEYGGPDFHDGSREAETVLILPGFPL